MDWDIGSRRGRQPRSYEGYSQPTVENVSAAGMKVDHVLYKRDINLNTRESPLRPYIFLCVCIDIGLRGAVTPLMFFAVLELPNNAHVIIPTCRPSCAPSRELFTIVSWPYISSQSDSLIPHLRHCRRRPFPEAHWRPSKAATPAAASGLPSTSQSPQPAGL